MNSVGKFSDPRQLQFKHLVLDFIMNHVDDLGSLLDQLLAAHLLHLDLLQLGLGVALGLARRTAPVAVAHTAGLKTMKFCSFLLKQNFRKRVGYKVETLLNSISVYLTFDQEPIMAVTPKGLTLEYNVYACM